LVVRSTFWLRFIRVVLGVMAVLDVVALLIAVDNPVQTFGTVQSSGIFAGDPYQHRMHQELGVSDVFVVPVTNTTTAQRVLYAVSHGIAFYLAVIPMLIMARRLIAGMLADDPFTPRVVRRLRVLGAVVLAGGAASELTEYVTARILLDSAVPAGLRTWAHPDVHLTLWWLMPGLLLLAFAEVVRRGRTLRDELDTII
jgi:hypothetical protein